MNKGAPVFVKVDEYKEIVEVLEMVKSKIAEMQENLNGINSIREEEDAELQMWNSALSEIQGKVDSIDKMMFEPEQPW